MLFKGITTCKDLFLKVKEIFDFLEWGSKEMTDVTAGSGRGVYGPSLHYSSRGTVLQNFFMQMKEVMDTVTLTGD